MKRFTLTTPTQIGGLVIGLGLMILTVVVGCKPLAAAEVTAARKSEDALCKAVVDTYRKQDIDAFMQLALSPSLVKQMMASVNVPESAKRESIRNKGAFAHQVQDSLQSVLRSANINWETAAFERFVPIRKPIEIATGYKMTLGRLFLKASEGRFSQPITLVQRDDNAFYVGDFGPFEPEK